MELLPKEIASKLPELYSQEGFDDPICSLKYFTPDSAWTWFVIEGEEQEDGDFLFFGKVVSQLCPEGELGYFTLSQLRKIRGPLGLPIERDLHFEAKPLSRCK
ncbi:hypothetical protein STSP2_01394 [Anaerohalosphaera lusitana]|uniref:DUF2958 domain-containing protein n=1 Tax=Anaerohalosphaera lusitana TaxID=1936003 RepID=A0A1U9NKH5_9BACT|nr:DUF2958 domain-containing protein [Anaerohalosphaera lusitana]AQT68238.1 hypothetical protein STSP2_01394 [Anaerohalosphaera lusitana]